MMRLLRMALESAKSVAGYKTLPTTEENIKKFKESYRNLSHVKTGNDFEGLLLHDGETFVAVVQCNVKTKYIVALEVSPDYQRQSIASKLLNYAVHDLDCNLLTVRMNNKNAISLYEKTGWKEFKREGIMIYMEKEI